MRRNRPALFKGRHFEPEMIILCVRRYLRFCLSYRNVEELMAERNLHVDHVTIWRWVQRYAPELNRRCRPELRNTNRSWRCDETYLRVSGKWAYLHRAVDPQARRSTSFSPRRVTRLRPNVSFRRLCKLPATLVHGSSTWTAILAIRGSSVSSSGAVNSADAADVVRCDFSIT